MEKRYLGLKFDLRKIEKWLEESSVEVYN